VSGLKPYRHGERVVLDIQQVIPLPEVADYQVRIREKVQLERLARQTAREFSRHSLAASGVPGDRISASALLPHPAQLDAIMNSQGARAVAVRHCYVAMRVARGWKNF
jgi:hypothetical protein